MAGLVIGTAVAAAVAAVAAVAVEAGTIATPRPRVAS
jgi:hypothetical protein